jgi:hypothetical protein
MEGRQWYPTMSDVNLKFNRELNVTIDRENRFRNIGYDIAQTLH